MILESIVTSVDSSGRVNIAPMGPSVKPGELESGDRSVCFTLKPFVSSRTYRNLIEVPQAVIHVTDDVMLFARGAVDAILQEEAAGLVRRLDETNWWPLIDCHRWFAVDVERVADDGLRAEMRCRVRDSKIVRPFFGFHRARHAVIEAAILATRTHLIPPEQIEAELKRLRPLVDKTAGPVEHGAFDLLSTTIHERLAATQ